MLAETVATEFKFSARRGYAQKEDISVSYQVVEDGPVDIVVVPRAIVLGTLPTSIV
jgi:hypothetical protein